MGSTTIQWCDKTWNPTRGCSRISEGCRNCYAEQIAGRFSGPGDKFEDFAERKNGGSFWTGRVELIPEKLEEPLHWRKPCRVFVNSMSDLFHEALPDEAIDRVFAVMALCPQHAFQVLTKRPERMLEYCAKLEEREVAVSLAITRTPWWDGPNSSPCAVGVIEDRIGAGALPNVWLGVSVEDQKTADERIPLLLQTPTAIRFVSYEPALSGVDFRKFIGGPDADGYCVRCGLEWPDEKETLEPHECPPGFGPKLSLIIVGGESGPHARPFHLEWMRSAVEQCRASGVAVFCKQIGSNPYWAGYPLGRASIGDHKGGDMAEWPADLRVREFPK